MVAYGACLKQQVRSCRMDAKIWSSPSSPCVCAGLARGLGAERMGVRSAEVGASSSCSAWPISPVVRMGMKEPMAVVTGLGPLDRAGAAAGAGGGARDRGRLSRVLADLDGDLREGVTLSWRSACLPLSDDDGPDLCLGAWKKRDRGGSGGGALGVGTSAATVAAKRFTDGAAGAVGEMDASLVVGGTRWVCGTEAG